jgi:hypothetical protein
MEAHMKSFFAFVVLIGLSACAQGSTPAPPPSQNVGDYNPARLLPLSPVKNDLPYYDGGAWALLSPAVGYLYYDGGVFGYNTPSTGGGGSYLPPGTYASRPAAGTAGRIYYTTDGAIAYMDNGSSWQPIIDGVLGTQPPANSSWTQVAFATGTTSADSHGAVVLTNGSMGVEQIQNLQVSGVAPGTAYTLTAELKSFIWTVSNNTNSNIGIGISDGTKYYILQSFHTGLINVAEYTNSTTFNSAVASGFTVYDGRVHLWLRIQNVPVSTHRFWQTSANGIDWYTLFTESPGAFLTETKALFYVDSASGNTQATEAILESWSLTSP